MSAASQADPTGNAHGLNDWRAINRLQAERGIQATHGEDGDPLAVWPSSSHQDEEGPAAPPRPDRLMPPDASDSPDETLASLLSEAVVQGDAADWLPMLPEGSVDLFFTSPPYADARAYAAIHPDNYVEWFLPFAAAMLDAVAASGSLVLNIKNRVARQGPIRGQRHPYVYELVLAMQRMGWCWIETYIWSKPNAIPGRFGPRSKDSFEYVYHFAKTLHPHFDLDAVRVPYKTDSATIAWSRREAKGRRRTEAGFGRDRSKVYDKGGADPGNIVEVSQSYNQHKGPAGQHTAVMPEGLAAFFVKALSPLGGVVIDPFAGSGTTVTVGRRLGRQAAGIELHEEYVRVARDRIDADEADDPQGHLFAAEEPV